uniref:Uncharacterized protein n=1 Tax=Naja naja TaxID=35670 RepID=A0A8C6VRN8_NAJNA
MERDRQTDRQTDRHTHTHTHTHTHREVGLLQQENNSLCVRLANIYHGSGMVDCWNEYQQKSVFRQKQNIELVKISLENQAIFKRLRDRKATYDRKQYEKDWQASLRNSAQYVSDINSHHPQPSGGCQWYRDLRIFSQVKQWRSAI